VCPFCDDQPFDVATKFETLKKKEWDPGRAVFPKGATQENVKVIHAKMSQPAPAPALPGFAVGRMGKDMLEHFEKAHQSRKPQFCVQADLLWRWLFVDPH